MISLMVSIVICLLVLSLIWWVVSLLPLPEPFPMLVQVALVIIFLAVLISYALPLATGDVPLHGYRSLY